MVILVPRICFAEEVLKEYQSSVAPGEAQKNRSNQSSRSGFLKAMRHLAVKTGDARHAGPPTTPSEESKARRYDP